MSEEEITLSESNQALIKAVDACAIARDHKNHIVQSLAIASGVNQVKAALSAGSWELIESLMNTHIGFVTDKNPDKKVYNKDKKEWIAPIPYSKEVVINCVAEALSLGLYLHNNEFNIIAGRCYPAQAGFKRKLSEFKRSTGIQTEIIAHIPQRTGSSYLSKCTVSWTKPKEEKEVRELSWDLQAFSVDAALGKVQKRASQWLFNELTENNWGSSEDYLDTQETNKINPRADDIVPEPQAPKITKAAILTAFKAASSVAVLEQKWKKAQTTEFKGDSEVIAQYNARKAELTA